MEIILNGFLSGIVLSLLVGPVFFSLLQTSIEKGFWSGFYVAIGVSLSDSFYIALCYFGAYQFFDKEDVQYLGYIGGGILLLFGLYYLFVKSRRQQVVHVERPQTRNPYKLILKGFIINGFSPMVLLFWLGTVGVATTEFGYTTPSKAIPYFAAIVVTVFLTDVIKAKLADQLRNVLTPSFVRTLNIVVGLAMVIFGGRLIYNADSILQL